MKHAGEKVHRAGKKVWLAVFLLCVASFSVGLDREIMVHREIGRGKEEKRMRGGPYQKKEGRNNFIFFFKN